MHGFQKFQSEYSDEISEYYISICKYCGTNSSIDIDRYKIGRIFGKYVEGTNDIRIRIENICLLCRKITGHINLYGHIKDNLIEKLK